MRLAVFLALGVTSIAHADVAAEARALAPELVAWRRDFHQHPELSNREERTARVVADKLRGLGLEVKTGVGRHGVVALVRGGRAGNGAVTIALRADMDALPVDETRASPYRSQVPGVMHACGHDAHTAMLLGAATLLARQRAALDHHVLLLFQPAEESAPPGERGGAGFMIAEGALTAFAGVAKPSAVYGLHVMPTLDVGELGLHPGALMASSDRLRIVIRGKASHGAWPHEGVDAVVVAAEAVLALQTIVSRRLDPTAPRVLTIGKVDAGRRYNILADEARLEGTLRTLDEKLRAQALAAVRTVLAGVTAAHGASFTLEVDDNAPVVWNDAALTERARAPLERAARAFAGRVLDVAPQMVAEDFALWQRAVPGVFYFLGVRNRARGIGAMNHTADFDLDEAALPLGVTALVELALTP